MRAMEKDPDNPEEIKIIGQCSGFKTLAMGGARFSIDLYEGRANDYALATELSRRRAVVSLAIAPYTDINKDEGQDPEIITEKTEKKKRKAGSCKESSSIKEDRGRLPA